MHCWQSNGFFGGHVALDFVNTVDDEDKGRARSGIPDWDTVIAWALAAGVINPTESDAIRPPSTDAGRELSALHAMREAAWRVLSAMATGAKAAPADLITLKREMVYAGEHATLAQHGRAVELSVGVEAGLGMGLVRARMALKLAEIFSRGPLDRLRECGRCTGLFFDHGRGAGRRWCRMETCGNRAKIERYRARSR